MRVANATSRRSLGEISMKHTFLSAASVAALLSAVLLASPALSQDQLRDSVKSALAQHSIDVPNFDSLSNTQILQLELIMNSVNDAAVQKAQVASLLAAPTECAGNAQLRESVQTGLTQHGITLENYDLVTGSQLVVLASILNSTDSSTDIAAQVEAVFASDSPIVGSEQLRLDAEQCVGVVNANVDLGALTPAELVEVQLIAGGGDSDTAKREAIEALAN
jgi:hypothetical protein